MTEHAGRLQVGTLPRKAETRRKRLTRSVLTATAMAAALVWIPPATAAVLCADQASGVVSLRELICEELETPVNLSAVKTDPPQLCGDGWQAGPRSDYPDCFDCVQGGGNAIKCPPEERISCNSPPTQSPLSASVCANHCGPCAAEEGRCFLWVCEESGGDDGKIDKPTISDDGSLSDIYW